MYEETHLADTKPTLEHIADMPENANLETIVIGGFGVRDSAPIAEALPELSRLGGVEALEQDDEGIDPHVIAQEIIDQAHKDHFTRVGLWGDSVGGIIVTKIARIIQESDSPLTVDYMVLDCTPTNLESLRSNNGNKAYIGWLQRLSVVFPKIADHPLVDYFSTQYFMQQRANAVGSGSRLGISDIINDMNNPEVPSASLLSAEALEVVNPEMNANFKAISQVTEKTPPLVFTIRPQSNWGDTVVISSVAEQEETKMATKYGLPLIKIKLSGISHADPTANQAQYDKALDEIIIPNIVETNNAIAFSKPHPSS